MAAPCSIIWWGRSRERHRARDAGRADHARAGRRARAEHGRVRAHRAGHWPRTQPDRARHLLGDVERTLLLQVVPGVAAEAAHRGALGHLRAGGERRRGGYRRWPSGGLQDGEPQPPVVHRALSGGGDRRRRHPARRVHHGCKARSEPRCAPLRRAGPPQDPPSGSGRGRGHRRLWQLHRRADRGRLLRLRSGLRRQHPGQRHDGRRGAGRPHLLRRRPRTPSAIP